MTLGCNNKCYWFKAEIDTQLKAMGVGAYAQGFKRCSTCDIFLNEDGIVINSRGNQLCRCCNYRLTLKPKRKLSRLKLKSGLMESIRKSDEKMLRRLYFEE